MDASPATDTALGVDLGGSSIVWTVVAADDVLGQGTVATPRTGATDVVRTVAHIVADAGHDVARLGVGVPGLVDDRGRTVLLPNVPGDWHGRPLADELQRLTGHRPALLNDARAFTLAELRLGAGRGLEDLVTVTLGTGVGGGVAVHGRLHLGAGGRAGEVGHQVVDPHGLPCGCGATGCVETLVSGPAILAGGVRAVLQGLPTSLREACGDNVARLTTADVVAAAVAGDTHAELVVARAGAALGAGLANLCTVLRPQRIVIGGGVAQALDALRPSLLRTLAARAPLVDPLPDVVVGELGPTAGAIGAALWAGEAHEHGPSAGSVRRPARRPRHDTTDHLGGPR